MGPGNRPVHCKKHHFVSNRYFYLNLSSIEAKQDIYMYLSQNEIVGAKHDVLSFQIHVVANALNNVTSLK